MSPAQIHLAIGVKLDQYVSKSTIKNELRRQVVRQDPSLIQNDNGSTDWRRGERATSAA